MRFFGMVTFFFKYLTPQDNENKFVSVSICYSTLETILRLIKKIHSSYMFRRASKRIYNNRPFLKIDQVVWVLLEQPHKATFKHTLTDTVHTKDIKLYVFRIVISFYLEPSR